MFCVNSDGARRAVDVSGGAGYSPYQAFRASASASFTATTSFDSAGNFRLVKRWSRRVCQVLQIKVED